MACINKWLLTANPLDFETEKKMLGRSRLFSMCTGLFRTNDFSIASATGGGAEADSAIKGTPAKALNPPIFLNEVLKSEPLHERLL